jgi:glycerophosphoryl diester phosphodiesterase
MSIAYNMNDKPLLFCHRGYHKEAPENSLSSFELVLENGFKAIETDIHMCKSGELVIMHDFNLKRMTGLDKDIRDLTLDQIKELNLLVETDSKFKYQKIPTLREVFELCKNDVVYDLEIKSNNLENIRIAKKTWQLIQEYHMEYNTIVSSFNPLALRSFEAISNNGIQSALIYSEGEGVPFPLRHGAGAAFCNCTILKPEYMQLNPKAARKAKEKNYKFLPWCVDTVEDAKSLINYNILGMISNRVDIIARTGFFY